jgi:hypothetical protein
MCDNCEPQPTKDLKEHKCYFFQVKPKKGIRLRIEQVEEINRILQETITGKSGGFVFSDAINIGIIKDKVKNLQKNVKSDPEVGYFHIPDVVESIKIKECIVKFKR